MHQESMRVERFIANGQSTSAARHGAHLHDLEDAVQNVERAFVLKDYQTALDLSSEVLSAESHSSLETERISDCCVCLQTIAVNGPLAEAECTEFSFTIRMSCDIALTDRAAVVALQSCYELSDTQNTAFLTWYARRPPMPIDVAILWIQFAFSTSAHKQTAVEMAAELLHHMNQFPHLSELSDDLLFMLFSKMLAYCENVDYVRDVLDRIHAPSWNSSRFTYFHMSKASNPQAVSILLAGLDQFSLNESVGRCREKLETLSREAEDISNKDEINQHEDKIVATRNEYNVGWKHLVAECMSTDWPTLVLLRHILNVFRNHVVRPLKTNDNRWKNRGRVAISAVLLYLAWKKRRRLSPLATTVATLVASPFREILEALRPQRS
jgi:hypothetical protein